MRKVLLGKMRQRLRLRGQIIKVRGEQRELCWHLGALPGVVVELYVSIWPGCGAQLSGQHESVCH